MSARRVSRYVLRGPRAAARIDHDQAWHFRQEGEDVVLRLEEEWAVLYRDAINPPDEPPRQGLAIQLIDGEPREEQTGATVGNVGPVQSLVRANAAMPGGVDQYVSEVLGVWFQGPRLLPGQRVLRATLELSVVRWVIGVELDDPVLSVDWWDAGQPDVSDETPLRDLVDAWRPWEAARDLPRATRRVPLRDWANGEVRRLRLRLSPGAVERRIRRGGLIGVRVRLLPAAEELTVPGHGEINELLAEINVERDPAGWFAGHREPELRVTIAADAPPVIEAEPSVHWAEQDLARLRGR